MTHSDDGNRGRNTRPAGATPGPSSVPRTAADGGQPVGGVEGCISPEDLAAGTRRHHREAEAHRIALLKIRERGLAMKLTRVEQAPDLSRLLFYFTAEGRVDFRELVKELASEFRTRIEMRQIGVRDEARMLGGYGSCGRPLCCAAWLASFEPVSIKMAKLQDLTLNPTKLSGLCGRLKCCLRFELASDKLLRKARRAPVAAPSNGDDVLPPDDPPAGESG
jgi:cell fate regulator YaaT (PSP1 superfamily)